MVISKTCTVTSHMTQFNPATTKPCNDKRSTSMSTTSDGNRGGVRISSDDLVVFFFSTPRNKCVHVSERRPMAKSDRRVCHWAKSTIVMLIVELHAS